MIVSRILLVLGGFLLGKFAGKKRNSNSNNTTVTTPWVITPGFKFPVYHKAKLWNVIPAVHVEIDSIETIECDDEDVISEAVICENDQDVSEVFEAEKGKEHGDDQAQPQIIDEDQETMLKNRLEKIVPGIEPLWSKDPKVSKMLITAEFDYARYEKEKNEIFDHSQIILQFTKTIEKMLRTSLKKIIERDHVTAWYGFQLDRDVQRIKPGENLSSWVKLYQYRSKEYKVYLEKKFGNDQLLLGFLINKLGPSIEPIHRTRGDAAHAEPRSFETASRVREQVLINKVYMNEPLIIWLLRLYNYL